MVIARVLEDLVHQVPTAVIGDASVIIVSYIYYKLCCPFQLGWLILIGLSPSLGGEIAFI